MRNSVVKITFLLLVSLGLGGCFLPGDFELLTTSYGKLIGSNNGNVKAFLGLRFAKPPVGDLRWAPPKPLQPWSGYKTAMVSGAGCIQGGSPTDVFIVNEDCLFLDVWAPVKNDKHPVMVWFHGGGLLQGSGSELQYRGEKLAQDKDVIVVNVNSRLSFLGYVASPGLTSESAYSASGNQGFLDQIEALKWVKSEIHHFGGDPDNITIFGESGGAISVCTLLASPLADGLFERAIMQSGSCRMVRTPDLAGGEQKGAELFEKIGCGDAADPLACARALPMQTIVDRVDIDNNELFVEHPDDWAYYPTSNVDGYFLPEHPIDLLKNGVKAGVDLLVGHNKDEGSMFVGLKDHADDEAGYLEYLQMFYGDMAPEFAAVYPFDAYPSTGHAAAAIAGDGFMDCPATEMGDIMSDTNHRVFMYQFVQDVNSLTTDIILQLQRGKNTPPWGTYHTAEIPYVFGFASVLGNLDTDERRHTRDLMMSYWTNFARNGDPNGAGLPYWPQYYTEQSDYMKLGGDFETDTDLKPLQCDFWINTFFAGGHWQ